MLVQDFLLSGGSLKELEDKYSIMVRRHKDYPSLVLLKYNQIDSPMNEPLVQECRGLILDEADNWRVICRPFNKFFNSEESLAANINWNTAEVQEKLDGSLCSLFFYDGKWHVSTSGSPDAGGNVHATDMTFKDLFWSTFKKQNLILPPYTKVDFTYMFELTTPYNRVVVQHKESAVTLIGIRNRFDGKEIHLRDVRGATSYPVVRSYKLNSIKDVVDAAAAINPMQQEGFVVVDSQFNRVKVKSLKYVSIHHLKDGFSRKRILEIIRTNESNELLNYFPEWKEEHDLVQTAYNLIVEELECDYNRLLATVDTSMAPVVYRKEYAKYASRTKCPAVLFQLLDKRTKSVRDFFSTMRINDLLSIMNIKNMVFNAE